MNVARIPGLGHLFWSLALTIIVASACFADDATPQPPKLPHDVTLTNGAVLHHVSVIRWGKETVTLKHDSGADPIRYSNMAPDTRKAFEDARDYYFDHPADTATKKADDSVVLTGQAFIQTAGAGPSKLGAMRVYAFPMNALSEFDTYQDTVNLPKPLASVVTDAEGRFKLTIPGTDPFFVFAQGQRRVGSAAYGHNEFYEWHIQSDAIEDRSNLLLQNENLCPPSKKKIEIAD